MNVNKAVFMHHSKVQEHYPNYTVILTSLIGSQNYGLATESSDIDTCSFILPPFTDFIYGEPLISKEFDCKDGKCVVKDLRLAFNLLRKPSPNSIEWFLSSYKYYNQEYYNILSTYLDNLLPLQNIVHGNYKNMLNAILGTAVGLHGRNMTEGKKYSHIIRLENLLDKYINSTSPFTYLSLPKRLREQALIAKNNLNDYSLEIEQGINRIKEKVNEFEYLEDIKEVEKTSQLYIDRFQKELFEVYLKENGYERKN